MATTTGERPQTLRSFLHEGPFTLSLAAGFFGFYAHAGVLRALLDEGHAPKRTTGSSAGSIVAAAYAARIPLDVMEQRLFALQRRDFWDPGLGLGLLRGHRFVALLEDIFEARTFESGQVPCAISIFVLRSLRTRVVTTGPYVQAIRASCSLPGMFHPSRVDGQLAIDGGVRDLHALGSVVPGERVLAHGLQRRDIARPGLVDLTFEDRPQPTSFALHEGKRAHAYAREATLRALDAPLSSSSS